MGQKIVTEAGYYAGKFLKPGQFYEEGDVDLDEIDLDKLTKDELVAEAERRGIAVPSGTTKADIVKLLSDQANG